ncbi:family 10 glycosylhydrolase [Kovacikia minuta CCNUW1]|uniref:family 10 glycosylhydrolase n=1 Tax=Kovacikia minuta TaxID=2931930 RepID=UPI001CCDE5A3|nr:family 10 glycosylhydrolase [Kovacikia minuta]UBF27613.1 family 10 glycosylhydrolase [Kovacikia minuta CCNUW1]
MRRVQFTVRHRLMAALLALGLIGLEVEARPAQAQSAPFCQQSQTAIAQKDKLRQAALKGNRDAEKRYKSLIAQHAEGLRKCRRGTWIQNQAIWIRLYPCDTRPGALDAVLDQIVNRGYNQINVEVFYNGRVLLPASNNPTPWPSVLSGKGVDKVDLLAQTIRRGRERGLKVYAWLFTMNFGTSYVRRSDKQQAIARNGLGQTSLTASLVAGLSTEIGLGNPEEAFIDPYSPQARQDYARMVKEVARHKPDGILFDYVRYPRGSGSASVASKVQDLWIYGESSWRTLLQRAMNYKGMEIIQRYLLRGHITADDLREVNQLYPNEKAPPLWQGLNPDRVKSSVPLGKRVTNLQSQLWQLSVAHAAQGVIDFLADAIAPAKNAGIPVGAVFFPEGNATVGQTGFDSRLQPWDRFPSNMEWLPMVYANCGDTSCIMAQVQRVLSFTPRGVQVNPVLAGIWQQPISNRPPLEQQMQALYRTAPKIRSVSHFAFSWQEPGSDRDRKFCQP